MPYVRPTLEQINARVQADFKAKIGPDASFLRRSWINILGRVFSGAIHLLYGAIQYAIRQLFTVTADDESIVKKAAAYGLTRKAPSLAAGVVRFTGTNGVTVPLATVLLRPDQARFETTAAVDISAGFALIPVRSVVAGTLQNTGAGVIMTLDSPLGGIDDDAEVIVPITGGADIESYDSLKQRLLTRQQKPPQGGAKSDYELWARELFDVGAVAVYGPGEINDTTAFTPPAGEVWVYYSTSAGETPAPLAISAMQAHMNTRKPVTATVRVYGTEVLLIEVAVAIKPSAASTFSLAKEDVKNSLIDLFDDVALPTATIYLSQIREAISRPSSEVNHTLLSPVADITLAVNQIGKLDITFYDANVTLLP